MMMNSLSSVMSPYDDDKDDYEDDDVADDDGTL